MKNINIKKMAKNLNLFFKLKIKAQLLTRIINTQVVWIL